MAEPGRNRAAMRSHNGYFAQYQQGAGLQASSDWETLR
jgi:hypothetical protein